MQINLNFDFRNEFSVNRLYHLKGEGNIEVRPILLFRAVGRTRPVQESDLGWLLHSVIWTLSSTSSRALPSCLTFLDLELTKAVGIFFFFLLICSIKVVPQIGGSSENILGQKEPSETYVKNSNEQLCNFQKQIVEKQIFSVIFILIKASL